MPLRLGPYRCQKKAGNAPALQKINHSAHKSFHFGAITSRDYTSQPLKPPMWRNGRRNGLKIRWAEKARAGSNPAIGKSQKLDKIYRINSIKEDLDHLTEFNFVTFR